MFGHEKLTLMDTTIGFSFSYLDILEIQERKNLQAAQVYARVSIFNNVCWSSGRPPPLIRKTNGDNPGYPRMFKSCVSIALIANRSL